MNTQGLGFKTRVPDDEEKTSSQMCCWDTWGTSGDVQHLNLRTNITTAFHSFYQRASQTYWGEEGEDSDIPKYQPLVLSNWGSAYSRMYKDIVVAAAGKIGQTFSLYPTTEMATLESPYDLRDRSEVMTFVACNLFLISLLQQIPEQVKRYFGKSTRLSLEVIIDQEEKSDKELIVFICTDLSPNEAFVKLRAFDHDWWLGVMADARGKLSVHVEFQ
ncbi:MAG: hypothetical protein NTZ04_01490 [Chloroflexi bacterium]|nr:hypothetical protein [Chloroflexota bacterium]